MGFFFTVIIHQRQQKTDCFKTKPPYVISVTFIFLTDSINTFLYIYKIIIFAQSIKDYVVEYIVFNIKIHPRNNYLQDITYKKR